MRVRHGLFETSGIVGFLAVLRIPTSAVRQLADRQFGLLKRDPRHPSLHFKRVSRFHSVRVGLHYRALGVDADVTEWCGSGSALTRSTIGWSEADVAPPQLDTSRASGIKQTPGSLVAWMTDVVDNRIVDLHDWAKYDYYNPGMRGRTSIKVVLDALWKSDAVMRKQFEAWTGMAANESRDPYASLPPVGGVTSGSPDLSAQLFP